MSVGNPAGHDQHHNHCYGFPPKLMQEKTLGSLRDHCRYPGGLPEYRQLTAFRLLRSVRSEEHTSELQSRSDLVCRLLLEKKKTSAPSSVLRRSFCFYPCGSCGSP